MGEARRRAEAAARAQGGTAADRAFLREAERRQEEVKRSYADDHVIRPGVLEAVDIEEAIEDPVFGRLVAYGLEVAELVASGEPSSHGAAACMTCDAAWTREHPPVVAVIGTYAGKKMAGLVCETCAEIGQERFMAEKLQPWLRRLGGEEPRLIRPAPGGTA